MKKLLVICIGFVICLSVVNPALAQGSITGTVTMPGNVALPGVMIGLYDQFSETLLASTVTDADGIYLFDELAVGYYDVDCILPIGFDFAEGYGHLVEDINVTQGATEEVDWVMEATEFYHLARSTGFWKHQFKANISGNGTGNIYHSFDELVGPPPSFAEDIFSHYYNALIDPIQIEGVTHVGGAQMDEYDFEATLSYKGNDMHQKACKQYLALLLNVVSGRLPQYIQFTQDDLYVTQVVYYINQLLTEGSVMYDPALAMDIAETMNHGEEIAAGVIPDSTPYYLYSYADEVLACKASASDFHFYAPSPNPFNPKTTLRFQLDEVAIVNLVVYDISGRLVATLVDGWKGVGTHEVIFDGANLASGMYIYRFQAGNVTQSDKMILMK